MYLGNQPALSYTSFAKQDFTTSATTSYTLDHPVTNENEIALFINFVRQEPTTAYTATGTSLTLTSATSASDDMYCVFLGKAVQTVNPPSGSVGISQLSATGTKDSTTFLRGDNTFNAPSVASLSTASGSAPSYSARAWVNFNGTGTPSIRASGNVSSITDVSTGRYKVNFTTNMEDTNYAVAIASQQANNNISQVHNVEAPNVAYVEFQRKENDTNYDSSYIFVTVIR